jgi:hypothetical protein
MTSTGSLGAVDAPMGIVSKPKKCSKCGKNHDEPRCVAHESVEVAANAVVTSLLDE